MNCKININTHGFPYQNAKTLAMYLWLSLCSSRKVFLYTNNFIFLIQTLEQRVFEFYRIVDIDSIENRCPQQPFGSTARVKAPLFLRYHNKLANTLCRFKTIKTLEPGLNASTVATAAFITRMGARSNSKRPPRSAKTRFQK